MKLKKKAKANKNSDNTQNAKKSEVSFFRRTLVIIVGVFSGILILFSRAYYLQIMRHDYYRTRSQKNRVKLQVLPPVRGNIFDRNGFALSENILSYDLIVNRAKSQDYSALVKKVAKYMRFDDDDLAKYQSDKRKKLFNQNVIVRTDLTTSITSTQKIKKHWIKENIQVH